MTNDPLSPGLPAPLPAILAGPLVRRLTPTQVSIWVATSTEEPLTLNIRQAGDALSQQSTAYQPYRIGQSLWLALIQADGQFQADVVYEYWLDGGGLALSSGYWQSLAYGGLEYPSFVGLPAVADQYRILHVSCRKPHGGGRDGMALIDALIANDQFPDDNAPGRPHLMFLTGDQIYADDVAAPLAPMIRTIRDELIAIDEAALFTRSDGSSLLDLKINGRQQACYAMGLTSSVAHDHLWTLGEFYAMYLLAWSDALWPERLPTWGDVYQGNLDAEVDLGLLDPQAMPLGLSLCSRLGICAQCSTFVPYHPPGEPYSAEEHAQLEQSQAETLQQLEEDWKAHCENLEEFRKALPSVRRLLANVPSYMLLDDHEVTDDWNLNYRWAQDVYAAGSAGQRMVVNGLLSYLLFQHWGNVPAAFAAPGSAENTVLAALTLNDGPGPFPHPAASATTNIEALLGVPSAAGFVLSSSASEQDVAQLRPPAADGFLPGIAYHFLLQPPDYPLRVIAIDGRTHREFVRNHPLGSRVSTEAIDVMIPQPPPGPTLPTLIIVPTPLLGMHLIEHYVQPALAVFDFGREPSGEAYADLEANWLTFGERFQYVLSRIAAYRDVIVLAGDVHYGFTKRLRYFDPASLPPLGQPSAVIAQLTASSARNADNMTVAVHTHGDALMQLGLTRRRTFRVYDMLLPPQQAALLQAPTGSLPWDEAVDVLVGRPFLDSLEDPPVAFSEEIAAAYGLLPLPSRSYEIDHFDDEVEPAQNSLLQEHMQDVVNLGLNPPTWGSSVNAANAAVIVQGLKAANLHRIGRVFAGLPQMGLVTLTIGPNGVDSVRHRLFVAVGRTRQADDPNPWYVLDTTVPYRTP